MKRLFSGLTLVLFAAVLLTVCGGCGGGGGTPGTTAVTNKVFVTSVSGNGNISTWADAGGKTGLAAADAVCQARANAAGLPGIFKAWLSDGNDDAYCRVHNLTGKISANCGQSSLPASAGPWVRMDGFPFGARIDQLLNGTVYSPNTIR